jgi:ABC-type multidrug transport system fused ATPase/permease subunit
MSTDRTLLDPWSPLGAVWPEEAVSPVLTNGKAESILPPGLAQSRPDGVVPPVRTIVLDRPPTAVAPPQQREAIRTALTAQGPERLSLRDVSIYYGEQRAVNSVSLSIHQGEVLALIGPSGCGKTSLLRTLNRLTELTPSASRSGEILLDGQDVHALRDTTLRSRVAISTVPRCASPEVSSSGCASRARSRCAPRCC